MTMPTKSELLVLLPAYNEEDNVEQMVASWEEQRDIVELKYGLRLKIVIINDGSKDQTKEISEELCCTYNNVILLNHNTNKGLGEAIKTGILYAVNQVPDCSFACIMDCDNTQDPKYISDMLDSIGAKNNENKADVVIASRYQQGSKVKGVARYRLLTSEGARYVYGSILHVKNVKDYTCGYRLYTKDILTKCYSRFGDNLIEESGFTCMAELLYKLYCVGARFSEVPFELRYDYKQGQSKMKVIKTAMDSIKLAFQLRKLRGTSETYSFTMKNL